MLSEYSLHPAHPAAAQQGSWEMDLHAHQLSWSAGQFRLYGYNPDELKLNDNYFIVNTTHPSDIFRVTRIIDLALKSHEGYHFKRRIIKKSGQFGFVQTQAKIIRSKSGEPRKIIGTTTDVAGVTENGIYDYNDPAFFKLFYEDYRRAITVVIYKMTFDEDLAKDLCQEVFLKAWQNMISYDAEKGKLYTWLVNIARNHCKDYLKSKRFRQKQLTAQLQDNNEDHSADFYELTGMQLGGFLLHLSIDQRELIDLIYIQGFTQTEIAAMKHLPLGTVKSRARGAIKKLLALAQSEEYPK